MPPTPVQYRVVFDLSQKGFQWGFPAFGLVFVAIGLVFIWIGRRKHWPLSRKFVGYFMVVFASLWSVAAFTGTYAPYSRVKAAYEHGQFSIAEGPVTSFHPMPYEGHQSECFSVESHTFCYSDYVVTPGFNTSASHGGPIREGVPVRVYYVGDAIVHLEVEADAVPTPAQSRKTVAAAQNEWQERQESDPVLDRLKVGFAVAVVFFVAWWNLQPRRFMRFWSKPPYKPLTVTLFRVFFAANLVGAMWNLVETISSHARSLIEYEQATGIAAAWIAVIWIMVTVVEWVNHRHTEANGTR